jgi:hypothetical protein
VQRDERAEDDRVGPQRRPDRAHLVDRRVGAEIGDLPAAVGQQEPEADETERVTLAGGARQQGDGTAAGIPALCER